MQEPWSEFLLHGFEEGRDGLLIALVENPLAQALCRHKASTMQRAEMSGHGGLRQAAAFELAGANAEFQRMLLRREMRVRILEVVQDLEPCRVGEGLEDFALVHGVHWVNIE
ncbi:hypothetical protein RHSP_48728 [Rhizobium freirei PRF 81]|uniref:Uncharacterized protein n=1 Tax=Rhizobium freirei PRF 81 TaxID=363754 RepID=N6V1X2_9HYPH|nr:hypothetical protein RHSP_48728 [Rhizobium freirei PRF 81]